MKTEISTRISPEGLEIANAYLELGNIPAVSLRLKVDEGKISGEGNHFELLGSSEIYKNFYEKQIRKE